MTPGSGESYVRIEGVSKKFGDFAAVDAVSLSVHRGEIFCLLGGSGSGKTTLLRMLAGADEPDTGQVEPGHGLKLGYYAQEHENLDVSRSVLANMKSAAPASFGETEVRKVLGSFLFSGDDVEHALVGRDPVGQRGGRHPDPRLELPQVGPAEPLPEDLDRAFGRERRGAAQRQQGGLARAVRPEDHPTLVGAHRPVEVVEQDRAAAHHADVAECEYGVGHRADPRSGGGPGALQHAADLP